MKLGFIGCGNMAKAMLGGILKNEICAKEDVIATAKSEASRENARNTYGIQVTADNIEAVKSADVLVLAVKPIFYEEVIHEIKDAVDEKKIIISIAPGKTLAWLEEQFGKKVKLVRCMPNTPALVGEGMTGVCCNEEVSDAEMQDVLKILESCGKAEMLPERLIDVVVSVSGSSPAYVFMFIEAMADAAFFLLFLVFRFLLHADDQVVFFIDMNVEVFLCHAGSCQLYFVFFFCFKHIDGRRSCIGFYHPIVVKEIVKDTW